MVGKAGDMEAGMIEGELDVMRGCYNRRKKHRKLNKFHTRLPLIFPWEKLFGNMSCISNMFFLKKNKKNC
jgi:hypothetical protein